MSKIHLAYDSSRFGTASSACESSRRQYHNNTQAAKPSNFKKYSEDELCSHCKAIFLKRRNKQRKLKGLAPVSKWNEGFNE